MARILQLEFEVVLKSIRQVISVLAWTWAIFVFILSYFGRGEYNHINNNQERGPPPLFQSVFVPVLKVLVVAPSAFGYPGPGPQAGNHASAQSGQFLNGHNQEPSPYTNGQQGQWNNWGQAPQQRNEGQLCAGCLPSSGPVLPIFGSFGGQNQNQKQQQFSSSGNNLGGGFNNGQQQYGFNSYDVQLTQPQWAQQQQARQQDPATVQHMQINDNGQYSFSYNSADSSRQEQRNLDGSVTGQYGYIDPTGQQVQVEYRAAPNEGYHAFGNNIPQANPQVPLPNPVQDTPEVQAARAQFFQAYDQQVQRIKQETEARNALLKQQKDEEDKKVEAIYSENAKENDTEGSSSTNVNNNNNKGTLASASDFKNLPEPIAVPDLNTLGQHGEADDDDELDNDAIVISSDDSENNKNKNKPKAVAVRVPQAVSTREEPGNNNQQGQGQSQPLYQLSQVVGQNVQAGGGGQQGTQREGFNGQNSGGSGGQTGQNQLGGGLPAYFYYVSVGGTPHYVTSNNLMRSDFPTSLKANLVGAIPLDAVHDAQVPQSSGGQAQVKTSPPVYLDFDKKPEGFNFNNNNNNNNNNNANSQQQQQSVVYGFIPGALVSFRNDQNQNQQIMNYNYNGQQQQQQKQQQQQSPFVGYPFFVFQK